MLDILSGELIHEQVFVQFCGDDAELIEISMNKFSYMWLISIFINNLWVHTRRTEWIEEMKRRDCITAPHMCCVCVCVCTDFRREAKFSILN